MADLDARRRRRRRRKWLERAGALTVLAALGGGALLVLAGSGADESAPGAPTQAAPPSTVVAAPAPSPPPTSRPRSQVRVAAVGDIALNGTPPDGGSGLFAGADEALMLDPHGMVATCNSTHFFVVSGGEVWTSSGSYCLAGITRANIITLCRRHGIPVFERDFSLFDVYSAEEAFVTGTFAGIVPAVEVDGRSIGSGARGRLTARLQEHYREFIDAECAKA